MCHISAIVALGPASPKMSGLEDNRNCGETTKGSDLARFRSFPKSFGRDSAAQLRWISLQPSMPRCSSTRCQETFERKNLRYHRDTTVPFEKREKGDLLSSIRSTSLFFGINFSAPRSAVPSVSNNEPGFSYFTNSQLRRASPRCSGATDSQALECLAVSVCACPKNREELFGLASNSNAVPNDGAPQVVSAGQFECNTGFIHEHPGQCGVGRWCLDAACPSSQQFNSCISQKEATQRRGCNMAPTSLTDDARQFPSYAKENLYLPQRRMLLHDNEEPVVASGERQSTMSCAGDRRTSSTARVCADFDKKEQTRTSSVSLESPEKVALQAGSRSPESQLDSTCFPLSPLSTLDGLGVHSAIDERWSSPAYDEQGHEFLKESSFDPLRLCDRIDSLETQAVQYPFLSTPHPFFNLQTCSTRAKSLGATINDCEGTTLNNSNELEPTDIQVVINSAVSQCRDLPPGSNWLANICQVVLSTTEKFPSEKSSSRFSNNFMEEAWKQKSEDHVMTHNINYHRKVLSSARSRSPTFLLSSLSTSTSLHQFATHVRDSYEEGDITAKDLTPELDGPSTFEWVRVPTRILCSDVPKDVVLRAPLQGPEHSWEQKNNAYKGIMPGVKTRNVPITSSRSHVIVARDQEIVEHIKSPAKELNKAERHSSESVEVVGEEERPSQLIGHVHKTAENLSSPLQIQNDKESLCTRSSNCKTKLSDSTTSSQSKKFNGNITQEKPDTRGVANVSVRSSHDLLPIDDLDEEQRLVLHLAVVTLYKDQIKPYQIEIRHRLRELHCSSSLERNFMLFYEAFDTLYTVENCATDVAVYLKTTPSWFSGWVDVRDPHNPYPLSVWLAVDSFIVKLLQTNVPKPVLNDTEWPTPAVSDSVFLETRGGRYGMAKRLKTTGPLILRQYSLGQVCHMVQLAVHLGILAYENGSLLPSAACRSVVRKLFPPSPVSPNSTVETPTSIRGIHDIMGQEKGCNVSSVSGQITEGTELYATEKCIKEDILSMPLTKEGEYTRAQNWPVAVDLREVQRNLERLLNAEDFQPMLLSQLKFRYLHRFKRRLDPLVFGFGRLSDFLVERCAHCCRLVREGGRQVLLDRVISNGSDAAKKEGLTVSSPSQSSMPPLTMSRGSVSAEVLNRLEHTNRNPKGVGCTDTEPIDGDRVTRALLAVASKHRRFHYSITYSFWQHCVEGQQNLLSTRRDVEELRCPSTELDTLDALDGLMQPGRIAGSQPKSSPIRHGAQLVEDTVLQCANSGEVVWSLAGQFMDLLFATVLRPASTEPLAPLGLSSLVGSPRQSVSSVANVSSQPCINEMNASGIGPSTPLLMDTAGAAQMYNLRWFTRRPLIERQLGQGKPLSEDDSKALQEIFFSVLPPRLPATAPRAELIRGPRPSKLRRQITSQIAQLKREIFASPWLDSTAAQSPLSRQPKDMELLDVSKTNELPSFFLPFSPFASTFGLKNAQSMPVRYNTGHSDNERTTQQLRGMRGLPPKTQLTKTPIGAPTENVQKHNCHNCHRSCNQPQFWAFSCPSDEFAKSKSVNLTPKPSIPQDIQLHKKCHDNLFPDAGSNNTGNNCCHISRKPSDVYKGFIWSPEQRIGTTDNKNNKYFDFVHNKIQSEKGGLRCSRSMGFSAPSYRTRPIEYALSSDQHSSSCQSRSGCQGCGGASQFLNGKTRMAFSEHVMDTSSSIESSLPVCSQPSEV